MTWESLYYIGYIKEGDLEPVNPTINPEKVMGVGISSDFRRLNKYNYKDDVNDFFA